MRDLDSNQTLQNAMKLVRQVYAILDTLPGTERDELRSQIQRAAVSVPANIAEGLGRGSPGELKRFLRIASGSAAELVVLLELAKRLHGVAVRSIDDRLDHVRRQLIRLTRSVHASRN